MIRWSEFSLASRLAGKNTRFALIFHTEGLVNPKVAKKIAEFGKGLSEACRPMLTVITPLCPQYHIDPLEDLARTNFPFRRSTEAAERDFKERLGQLTSFYDVGYHGHFFEMAGGRCKPAFGDATVRTQFLAERKYLADLGYRPEVYAGGWWFISPSIAALLAETGFRLDTTVNDVHADSFGRPQPYPNALPGTPYMLRGGLVEVPSVRSISGFKQVLVSRRRMENLVVLALHDYDLMFGGALQGVGKLMGTLVQRNAVLTVGELADQAHSRLRDRKSP